MNINARDRVSLYGQESYSLFITPSSIFTQVDQGSVGQGGDLTIATVNWVTLNPQEQKSTTVGEN
ncbi:hypothetical protein [Nostoc sp.]|uniref:hypothetical protein n=1 Tax=Nostoc sp. TaxID=1180 RepID=UPI002FF4807D